MKKLTIIVPFKNLPVGDNRLISRLRTVEKSEIEIILVHDRVESKIPDELRKVLSNSKNIKLIEGDFGGPGQARNVGLSMAKGEFITFWDSDDLPILENYYEMASEFRKSEKDVAIGAYISAEEHSPNHEVLHSLKYNELLEIYLNVGLWRMIIKKSKIGTTKFESLRMAEDQLFFANLKLANDEVFYFDKPVYKYFYGSSSHLTGSDEAIKDLNRANLYIRKFINDGNTNTNVIAMYFKQKLTILKRGSMKSKVTSSIFLPVEVLQLRAPIKKILSAGFAAIMKSINP